MYTIMIQAHPMTAWISPVVILVNLDRLNLNTINIQLVICGPAGYVLAILCAAVHGVMCWASIGAGYNQLAISVD